MRPQKRLPRQVLDHFVVFAVEPAEERRDEQVYRNHGPSLRHAATGVFGHYVRQL